MTTFNRREQSKIASFPRGIGWKLRVVLVTLLSLVLLVGGSSLYWIRSILIGLEDIEREGLHVDVARDIHGTLQGIISAYVSANLEQKDVSKEHQKRLIAKLNADLRRYHESAASPGAIKEIDRIIAKVTNISERVRRPTPRSSRLHRKTMTVADLNALRDAEQRIESIVEHLSKKHEEREDRRLAQDRQMLGIMLSFYVAFVGLGIVLIVGANFMVRRLIIRPLKSLVQATSEIARGNLSNKVAVSSKDEIGQLSHTFNLMLDKLRDNEERLRGMAILEERGRLAQELHDSLAQELAVLHIELIKAQCSLSMTKTADVRKMIRAMREIVDRAYQDVRESIFGLRATALDNFDLVHTLPQYLLEFSARKGIPVDLVVGNPEDVQLAPHAEIQLVRIIHEALSNVSKHAQATRSIVKFERDGNFARITIEDNGRGFTLAPVMDKNLHFGLQIMRERAEGVSGTLKVESAPGRGTKVMVYLPLEQSAYDTYPIAVGG